MSDPSSSSAPPSKGLTTNEAQRLLATIGANVVPDVAPTPWRRALDKFWAPVPWMLEAAILLQCLQREYVEAAVIAVLLVFNAALGLLQEGRAQATLDALKSRLALLAVTRRDDRWSTLAASDLVPGDVVKLVLGSIVPADVRLLEGSVLLDQSMLTGESLPVEGNIGTSTYAGSLVRRGEAVAEVMATGARTKFGKTAQLVTVAHETGTQQQTVLRVVRNLAIFSAIMIVAQIIYATAAGMPVLQVIPLVLTAILAAIPVALAATFTLAAALAARTLVGRGVLPTRLSAIDEAATMDVLCTDKTGTLTQNELAVTSVQAMPAFDEARVLDLASLASADGGLDPVDTAVREAAARSAKGEQLARVSFVPFDPAQKMSQAEARDASGQTLRIVKGAYDRIARLVPPPESARAAATHLEGQGYRVLAVAAGPPGELAWAGLIALSDPPRPDARALIAELESLGVRTVMVTGDAVSTAQIVARAVGLDGPMCPPGPLPEAVQPGQFTVFAGVFPEGKFHIVRAFQQGGHTVGMCGDGANDAPALRQAQIGIAVSTATDVAKSAAGVVLTQPGLGGIVEAVRCGRMVYQRILTYTLRSFTTKISQMLFLTVGLMMTGQAILTPMLMVILMITGDFLAMSATTDHVRPSQHPNVWRVGRVTATAIGLGVCNLAFCCSVLAIGVFRLGLQNHGLRTLAAVILVCSSQATFYVVRERRHLWSSRPSAWVMLSSMLDVSLIALLAGYGILMHALAWSIIAAVIGGSAVFALILDLVKTRLFSRLGVA